MILLLSLDPRMTLRDRHRIDTLQQRVLTLSILTKKVTHQIDNTLNQRRRHGFDYIVIQQASEKPPPAKE